MDQEDTVAVKGLAGQGHTCSTPAASGTGTKACAHCDRITIGGNYDRVSPWRVLVGLPFVYLPVLVMPFILLGGALVYIHLRMMGASDLKTLRDFLPDWDSHRYHYKTQIVKQDIHPWARWARARFFWVFNCTLVLSVQRRIAGMGDVSDQGGGKLVVSVSACAEGGVRLCGD